MGVGEGTGDVLLELGSSDNSEFVEWCKTDRRLGRTFVRDNGKDIRKLSGVPVVLLALSTPFSIAGLEPNSWCS